jgi:hypothetical protein
VPWVAPEQGVSLHRCTDTRYSALKSSHTRKHGHQQVYSNSKTCEQGMQHLFIDVRDSNSYSRVKWA